MTANDFQNVLEHGDVNKGLISITHLVNVKHFAPNNISNNYLFISLSLPPFNICMQYNTFLHAAEPN